MKCSCCDCGQFIAHQLVRMDVIVDGNGEYIDAVTPDAPGMDIYDSETPYGPFQCVGCGAEYDALSEGEVPFSGPVEGWTWAVSGAKGTAEQKDDLRVVLVGEEIKKDMPDDVFYQYQVGNFELYFSQNQNNGGISWLGISQNDGQREFCRLYAVGRSYPTSFYLGAGNVRMSAVDTRVYARALEKAGVVLDTIQKFFETSKHRELYEKYHLLKTVGDLLEDSGPRSMETEKDVGQLVQDAAHTCEDVNKDVCSKEDVGLVKD